MATPCTCKHTQKGGKVVWLRKAANEKQTALGRFCRYNCLLNGERGGGGEGGRCCASVMDLE